MTLAVPPELQYSLIEFIAHVNAEDYAAMPEDFVNLGFTPPSQLERVRPARPKNARLCRGAARHHGLLIRHVPASRRLSTLRRIHRASEPAPSQSAVDSQHVGPTSLISLRLTLRCASPT